MDGDPFNLRRFVDAQQVVFRTALSELAAGAKRTHWMWFIFPQLAGLGRSQAAQFYAIGSLEEARAYLAHPLLGPRLRECVSATLYWAGERSPAQILGSLDAVKLHSSLTLFEQVRTDRLFEEALEAFYEGKRDERTLALLNGLG